MLLQRAKTLVVDESIALHQHAHTLATKTLLVALDAGVGPEHPATHEHICEHDVMGFALPAILLVAILGTYMGMLLWRSSERPTERAFVVGYFLTLADSIIFSLVIPDSYGLVTKLGGEAYMSGLVVGIYKFGTFVGAALVFMLLRWHSMIWKDFARHVFLVCGLCSVIGTVSWLVAALVAGSSQSAQNAPALLGLLLFGRVAGGVGAGIRLAMLRAQIPGLNSLRARPMRQASLLFAIQIGMGLGPLIAGSSRLVDNALCPALAPQRYETVGLVGLAISLTCLFAVTKVLPLTGAQEFDPATSTASGIALAEQETVGPQASALGQQIMIVGCLGFSMLRAFVVSGGEVTTAMLLEVEFKWTEGWIGIAIGACLLGSFPLSMVYARCGAMLSIKSWIKVMLGVSMCGCILYFECPAGLISPRKPSQVWQASSLLVADVLVLSSFWLSDALSQGVMMGQALRSGSSIFSQSNINMFQVLLLDGVCRTVGPALSRGQADLSGRNGYAKLQTLMTLAAVILSLLVILPRVQEHRASLTEKDEEDLKLKAVVLSK